MYNNLLDKHFNVQKGMYFYEIKKEKNFLMFLSDKIEDCFWNYAIIKNPLVNLKQTIEEIENSFKSLQKDSCLYLVEKIDSKILDLIDLLGYSEENSETWLTFDNPQIVDVTHCVKKVCDKTTREDFLSVFIDSYCGEFTLDSPYGALPETYIQSLKRTLRNCKKFIHFVVYDENNVPVSIASLCVYRDYAGIYNVGTRPVYRKRGFGTDATMACINYAAKEHLKFILLQTEENSNVEKFYRKIGFRPEFVGKMYVKTNK